jgi:hypothetical protein
LADDFVEEQCAGLAVLNERGLTHANRLESAIFENNQPLPIETWFGPRLLGVAMRPIGVWNFGPRAGTTAYFVGQAEQATIAAVRLLGDAPRVYVLSRDKTFVANRRYLDASLGN